MSPNQNEIPTARIVRRNNNNKQQQIRVPLFLAFGNFNDENDCSHRRLRQTYEAAKRVQRAVQASGNPKTLSAVMAAVSGMV